MILKERQYSLGGGGVLQYSTVLYVVLQKNVVA